MAPGIGRHIGQQFAQTALGTDIIYSFVIIICSLMIYFATKDLYELSSHKGIKYFRTAFLFFAIAYFFRSLIKFLFVFFDPQLLLIAFGNLIPFISPITLFLFMYFNSMAVLYLLYSVMWKKLNGNSNKILFFHILAIVISAIITLSANLMIYLWLNVILFILLALIFLMAHKDKKIKKKNNMYVIYLLLLIFWTLNILDILVPNIFQTFQILTYLASVGIFLIMLYKVLKKTN